MSRHMFTPTSEAAFGKGGILRLGFRETGRHIAALTLEQMCRLFYLKRGSDSIKMIDKQKDLDSKTKGEVEVTGWGGN